MTRGVLSFSPGDHGGYDDTLERYHFQQKGGTRDYPGAAKQMIGDWILIYEPGGKDGKGRKVYLGIARATKLEEDQDKNFFIKLSEQQFFDVPVPQIGPNGCYEEFLRNVPLDAKPGVRGRELQGRSVRTISNIDFAAIVFDGFKETRAPENAIKLGIPAGFDLSTPPPEVPDEREWFFRQYQANRIARDAAFRGTILKAYDAHCAISHLPALVNGGGKLELHAAHIKPVESGGPDIVNNGFPLTGTVHWMFDRGLITVDPDSKSIIVADNRVPPEWRAALKDLKEKLRPPKRPEDAPAKKFLEWHRTEKFGVCAV